MTDWLTRCQSQLLRVELEQQVSSSGLPKLNAYSEKGEQIGHALLYWLTVILIVYVMC